MSMSEAKTVGDLAAAAPTGPVASPAYRRWQRAQRRRRLIVVGSQLGLVAILLVLWEISARMLWVNPLLTSYPSAVARSMITLFQDGLLLRHTWVTLMETLTSFAASTVLGVILAIWLWLAPTVRRVLDPFLIVANAVPKIALVPIFYIWLGPALSIYGIAIAVAVFIVLLMVYTGFEQTDKNKVKLIRALGGSTWQVLQKVVLPANRRVIIAAMKANIGLSLVGVIVGEFQSAKAGLGYLIVYGSQIFQMDMVMSAVVILGVISLVLFVGISSLEKWTNYAHFTEVEN
ncbi:ABC transporter permease [Bradyrhizobium sp. NP1]|uniref:ABC transporter permease n=1 Tax=Bradyrhizobium sp. NP1 TaxID=3049772 RepID=UPI0025A51F5A|nr:ABC transporter permease [Bradyrhizobium sp. NP1]WJR79934.1 ABC transporter permease [Bradyrhizobium sp. NP1]